ncbi:MAG: MCE family protein [Alphaproteobacteria bacterium]|nr:MCE family protein [Alphaproteobacteria bacterium]
METRAPYVLIGAFVLAVAAAVFGFVYWLSNVGGLGERTPYRVQFENSVSGMLVGAAVLFNGIRVGEVTSLDLDPEHPSRIVATVAVATGTPVRADTKAGIDFQGISGVAVVTLNGGDPKAPRLVSTDGKPPVIAADPMAWQTMTQAARTVLQRLDNILAENQTAFKTAIANISTFAEALGRNSARIDGIVVGLERMTGGGAAAAAAAVYDLTAPREFPPLGKAPPKAQLGVGDPTAVLMLDSQRIVVRPDAPKDASFADAKWSDNVPKLVQSKLIQAIENSNYFTAVGRQSDGLTNDFQLAIDVRTFQISTRPSVRAEVELSAKIVGDNGRIVASRVFRNTVPTEVTDAAAAAAALDRAFGQAAAELVAWAAQAI